MFKIQDLILSLLLTFALNFSATAAIFERDFLAPVDGFLTYDSVAGNEWLDLTATLDWSVARLTEALAPGGELSDFRLAKIEEVSELAGSAGVEWTDWDLQAFSQWPKTPSAVRLIDYLGVIIDHSEPDPHECDGDLCTFDILDLVLARITAGHVYSEATSSSELVGGSYGLIAIIGGDLGTPGKINPHAIRYYGGISLVSTNLTQEILGPFWLVRPAQFVPEPTSMLLISIGITCSMSRLRVCRS